MADPADFHKQAKKIEELVREVDSIADPAVRSVSKELVQSLMDLHGAGLERILEIVFSAGDEGVRLIEDLGQDPLVGSLLVLYGIHPDELETRVKRKLDQIRSKLHNMGASVASVNVTGGEVQIRLKTEHACGSSVRAIENAVKEEILDAGPDVTALKVQAIEQAPQSGFVGLEKLLASRPVDPAVRSTRAAGD